MSKQQQIKPQTGFQEQFLKCDADIAFGGGAAGSGKSYALLLEPLYHVSNPDFGAVCFRRTTPQIRAEGGLWDASSKLYAGIAEPKEVSLKWLFDSGATIKFSHLEYEKNIYDWQGTEVPLLLFDEITHFTKKQFFYLLSRNRSTSGVKPYVRATCNPEPDSWVAEMIDWWIDEEGFIIKERCGVKRYFASDKGNLVWGDSVEEVYEKCKHLFQGIDAKPEDLIKSFTFIEGDIHDNKELLKLDPSYLSNLLAQDEIEVKKLYHKNWKHSTDELSLFEYDAINDLFTNQVHQRGNKYITLDHARFGRDLCVIISWIGDVAVKINVMPTSDTDTIVKYVNSEKQRLGIPSSNIICDQDGIGVIDAIRCKVFQGNATAVKVGKQAANYKNLKTQCAYLYSSRVNNARVAILDNFYVDNQKQDFVYIGNTRKDIKTLIKQDLRSYKRADTDGDGKKKIISKAEQKNILGRSPDFGDAIIMKESFNLQKKIITPNW